MAGHGVTTVDLSTLYFLAIGTLLVSAGMTLWERASRPERARELGTWAAGYLVLAIGCFGATVRHALPGPIGSALTNLLVVAGYLLILDGIAAYNGRRYAGFSVGLLVALALSWSIAGPRWPVAMWNFGGAAPIAFVSMLMGWTVHRGCQVRPLRSRSFVAAVTIGHGAFYLARAFALPFFAAKFGESFVAIVGKATIYEGVLYSVLLPMALISLVREEAHGQLLHASRTDFLTGLGNRQWFFEEGAHVVRSSASGPVALLAFDLDRFKTINDLYGHATGDDVLKAFAEVVRTNLRSDAVIARIGGEEFAALLPTHDEIEAHHVAQAVATLFARTVVRSETGTDIASTVSIGIAVTCAPGADLARLLSNADKALYSAKARGRNRIEFAQVVPLASAA